MPLKELSSPSILENNLDRATSIMGSSMPPEGMDPQLYAMMRD